MPCVSVGVYVCVRGRMCGFVIFLEITKLLGFGLIGFYVAYLLILAYVETDADNDDERQKLALHCKDNGSFASHTTYRYGMYTALNSKYVYTRWKADIDKTSSVILIDLVRRAFNTNNIR